MKKATFAVACLLFSNVLLTACNGKNNNDTTSQQDSIATERNANEPFADAAQRKEYEAHLGGKTFKILISRTADKTQPIVTDELGKKFYDNRVDVSITCDGVDFFSKSYTKDSFSEFLTSKTDRIGTVLLGMAYDSDRSSARTIHLGAQVGQVGIEEGPAFSIEIPLNGGPSSIVRDANQDTTGDDGMSD